MRNTVKPGRENKRGSHVKLSDVAKRVGVSPITISRALRNPDIVSEELREVILRAVEEMGYIPNLAARALAGRHSGIVGVITPSLHHPCFTGVMMGIEDRLRATDLRVQYANTLHNAGEEIDQFKSFLAQKPAGIILVNAEYHDGLAPLMETAAFPVAHVADLSQPPETLLVGVSHDVATAAATRFLLSKGYRRIGFIGGLTDIRSARSRAGYEETMQRAGLHDVSLTHGQDGSTSIGLGRRLFGELLERAPDLDAVLAQNDDLALGALIECNERGISVPDDFGICGFNDLEFAQFTSPPLTTVHVPRHDIGHRVADMLLRAIREEAPGEHRVDLGFSIIERGSTRS
jgi:LacI family transcriptional regulator, gluconate utilization system Gnt-I transcriptional repressor